MARQHITKGHREVWIYWVGILRRPVAEDELSPEHEKIYSYLQHHNGAMDRAELYEAIHPDPKDIDHLIKKGILWMHPSVVRTSRLEKHGESVTIVQGVPVPDGPDRVTVTDEETYNKALEIIARGPVLISTRSHAYQIDDFDQAAEIVSNQLIEYGYALVEAIKPKAVEPSRSTLAKPIMVPQGEVLTVHVVDDKSFEKALELVTKGPVTITAKNIKYTSMTDFDKVAERLVYLLNVGYQPWVDARPIY